MAKVQTIFLPVKATVTPLPSAAFKAGDEVTIDTNVPAFVLFTLDGSLPKEGEFGTFKEDAPFTIKISTTTTLRFKAVDNRLDKEFNQTKTQKLTYSVSRKNPSEIFRDNKHFFKKLDRAVVDHNFYIGGGDWTVPTSDKLYSYLFKNIEGFRIKVRLLHNGIDALNVSPFPEIEHNGTIEFFIPSRSGDNSIEVQTAKAF